MLISSNEEAISLLFHIFGNISRSGKNCIKCVIWQLKEPITHLMIQEKFLSLAAHSLNTYAGNDRILLLIIKCLASMCVVGMRSFVKYFVTVHLGNVPSIICGSNLLNYLFATFNSATADVLVEEARLLYMLSLDGKYHKCDYWLNLNRAKSNQIIWGWNPSITGDASTTWQRYCPVSNDFCTNKFTSRAWYGESSYKLSLMSLRCSTNIFY